MCVCMCCRTNEIICLKAFQLYLFVSQSYRNVYRILVKSVIFNTLFENRTSYPSRAKGTRWRFYTNVQNKYINLTRTIFYYAFSFTGSLSSRIRKLDKQYSLGVRGCIRQTPRKNRHFPFIIRGGVQSRKSSRVGKLRRIDFQSSASVPFRLTFFSLALSLPARFVCRSSVI